MDIINMVNPGGITPLEDLLAPVPKEILPEHAPKAIARMNVAEFLPSRLIRVKYVFDSPDLTIWQPLTTEVMREVGPRRMWPFFFNGVKSIILNYIFLERKLSYWFIRRKISYETYDKSIRYLKYRIDSIERAIAESIIKENLPLYHENTLLIVLKEQLDRGFRFRRFREKNGNGKSG